MKLVAVELVRISLQPHPHPSLLSRPRDCVHSIHWASYTTISSQTMCLLTTAVTFGLVTLGVLNSSIQDKGSPGINESKT